MRCERNQHRKSLTLRSFMEGLRSTHNNSNVRPFKLALFIKHALSRIKLMCQSNHRCSRAITAINISKHRTMLISQVPSWNLSLHPINTILRRFWSLTSSPAILCQFSRATIYRTKATMISGKIEKSVFIAPRTIFSWINLQCPAKYTSTSQVWKDEADGWRWIPSNEPVTSTILSPFPTQF